MKKLLNCAIFALTALTLLTCSSLAQSKVYRSYNTVAEMVADVPSQRDLSVDVAGYYAPNDGGGGTFVWNSQSLTNVDNGIVFLANGISLGRWIRKVQGPLNPLWYGVKADDSTDNYQALQRMIYTAERTTNSIEFPSVKLPIRTSTLWITNGINLVIKGNGTKLKMEYNVNNIINYSGNPQDAHKSIFYVVGATNSTHKGEIYGFNFSISPTVFPDGTGQTSGTLYYTAFFCSDNWDVHDNIFNGDRTSCPMAVGNGGSYNISVHDNVLKDTGVQCGIGYVNSIVQGGIFSNVQALVRRGAWGYSIKNNYFYGGFRRKPVFISAGPAFQVEGNYFDFEAGNTAGANAYQNMITAYVGDVGWTDKQNVWQTNFVGSITKNIIYGTADMFIQVRGNEQQSSIAYLPSLEQINVDYIQTQVLVSGNKIRSYETNGIGIVLSTARNASVFDNDVISYSSPIFIQGDCGNTVIARNYLRGLHQGDVQGGTLSLSSSVFNNTGKSENILFDKNTIVSSPEDEFFMRSAAAYGSDLRNCTFRNNEFIFTGTGSGNGGPKLFSIAQSMGHLSFIDNKFWLTNNMSGRTLMDITGIDQTTNSCVLLFKGNTAQGISNSVPDIRGIAVSGFYTSAIQDNKLGVINVQNGDQTLIEGNLMYATNSASQITVTSVRSASILGNVIKNDVANTGAPIAVSTVTQSTVSGNVLDIAYSSYPILASTSGRLNAFANTIINTGSGGTYPGVSGSAVFDTSNFYGGTVDATRMTTSGQGFFRSYGSGIYGDANTEFLELVHNGTGGAIIRSGKAGSGTARTLYFYIDSTLSAYAKAASFNIGSPATETSALNVGGGGIYAEGAASLTKQAASTSTPQTMMTISSTLASQNAGVGFGSRIRFDGARNGGPLTTMGFIDLVWENATAGVENSKFVFTTDSASSGKTAFEIKNDGALTFFTGVRQTFKPDTTTPGFNVGSVAGDPSGASAGDYWLNSLSLRARGYENGVKFDVNHTRFTQSATNVITSSSSELTAFGSGVNSKTFKSGEFAAGKTYEVRTKGYISSTGSPTVTVRNKLGSTTLATSAAITVSGASNLAFETHFTVTCLSSGSPGKFVCTGEVVFNGTRTEVVQTAILDVDTAADQVADVTLQWSAPSSSNTYVNLTGVISHYN